MIEGKHSVLMALSLPLCRGREGGKVLPGMSVKCSTGRKGAGSCSAMWWCSPAQVRCPPLQARQGRGLARKQMGQKARCSLSTQHLQASKETPIFLLPPLSMLPADHKLHRRDGHHVHSLHQPHRAHGSPGHGAHQHSHPLPCVGHLPSQPPALVSRLQSS